MSRIVTPAPDTVTGATAEVYAQIKKVAGRVPNAFAVIGAHAPTALKAVLQAEAALAAGSLSKQDQETIKLIVSEVTGCDYCATAHAFLGNLAGLKPDALRQLRTGEPTGDPKRDALARFVRILAQTSGTISGGEFQTIRSAGYTDAQLVDISLAIALTVFTNVFNRINNTDIDFPTVA
ncbi:MAG TPA: carboxymuconolactone decarboxylase family protein [Aliidongia sp.]|nr:carboxymuconolactone decarboxylase family protein [Aliidongia sp.]